MKVFLRIAAWSSALAIASALALAEPQDSTVKQLTQLNATLQTATKNYDVRALGNLTTDDYELVSARGKVYNRRSFLADAADRSARYLINEPENVSVRHYNRDCAIVTAILHVRYTSSGKIYDARVRYGDVWVKLDGQWKYAYGQASPYYGAIR
jgi:ketosteroid isomerase-like protein